MKLCQICKRPLTDQEDSLQYDCGGDCLECMAKIAGDPKCIEMAVVIYINKFYEEVQDAVDNAKARIASLPHEDPVEAEYSAIARMSENLRVW